MGCCESKDGPELIVPTLGGPPAPPAPPDLCQLCQVDHNRAETAFRRVADALAAGADPNRRGDRGMAPLHFACDSTVPREATACAKHIIQLREVVLLIVERLAEAGADPAARADDGRTPAQFARPDARGAIAEAIARGRAAAAAQKSG